MDNLIHKEDTYYTASRADVVEYIDNNPRTILEIGCGEGNFASNFPDAEYWGVEPNNEMSQRGTSLGKKILSGTYESVANSIPNGYFDLVACNDVIEHMVDPIGFLKAIQTKLKPNGKLIASIPNIRFAPILFDLIFKGEFDYTESGIMDYTHLHFFTPKSFAKIATHCGWIIELIKPLSIAPFKPLKDLLLRLLKQGGIDMRNIQFIARLSRPTSN